METDSKELFRHLHKELVDYQIRFVDLSFKSAGLIILVLGWLLTSATAQNVLAANTIGRAAVVVGVIIMNIAYVAVAVRMMHVMQQLAKQVDALEYMPRSYYSFRALPPRTVIAASAVTIIPSTVTIAFVLFGTR